MENPEEVLQLLERFSKLKQKEITPELEDYLSFVARTGDTVYRWAIVKHLFREKLVNVITDFHENTPSIADLPQCPNVDPFNYERMKRTLLERLDAFNSAPFTVQRICELLTEPRKQYTRIDKFMRAVEKNILVVSTQEPGRRRSDSENGDSLDSLVNGDLEVNVDIEMDNEAFGIDSNEIVSDSVSAAPTAANVVEAGSEPAVEAVVTASVAVSDEEAAPKEPESEGARESADDTSSSALVEKGDQPVEATIVGENGTEDHTAPDKAIIDTAETTETPNEDLESAEKISESDPTSLATKLASDEESDAVSNNKQDTREVSPDKEPTPSDASDATTAVKEDVLEEPVSITAAIPEHQSTADESVDDEPPRAKLAKLSEEDAVTAVDATALESQQAIPLETTTAVYHDKDEASSGSTTDSGGSSTSVDSDSISPSNTEISTSTCAEATETVAVLAEEAHVDATEKLAVQEAQPVEVVLPVEVVSAEPVAEVPTEPIVEASLNVVAADVKPIEVELEPTVPFVVAPDEMETASSTVASESVMATDEEESTLQGPADVVIPMAADASEATKPDDSAMDVDESSVEPMDQ